MRPYECLLTAEGKSALLEHLMEAERSVHVQRVRDKRGISEEWRVGRRIRYEWCSFWKQADTDSWSVTFGGNFTWPRVLEAAFRKIVATKDGCSWIWPGPMKKVFSAPSQFVHQFREKFSTAARSKQRMAEQK